MTALSENTRLSAAFISCRETILPTTNVVGLAARLLETRVPVRARVRAPDATVLELGAFLGVVSCVLNKKPLRPERHVAVEGNPRIIDILARNKELNGCRFQIEKCVISHRSSEEFFLGASIVLSGMDREEGQPLQVAGRSITDLEAKYGFQFDFLLMDIEGGEFDILSNQREFLARCLGLVVEKHPQVLGQERIQQYEEGLRDLGFTKIKSVESVDYFHRAAAVV